MSRRRIAQILNQPRGTISRRINRLLRRLRHPLILMLLDDRCPLPEDVHQLGIEHFLHRRTIRQLVVQHNRPQHEIRLKLLQVRLWHRIAGSRR